jgi:cell division protein FtsL
MIEIFAQAEIPMLAKIPEYGAIGICVALVWLVSSITKQFVNLQIQNNTTLNATLMELKTSNVQMSAAITGLSTEIRTLALMKRKNISISENNEK